MDFFSSQFKFGILGGGQLGKMLLSETRKFDIQTYVLDPNEDAPSKIACNKFFQGNLMDFETVYNFGKQVDILTFEIEMVNIQALEQLEAEGVQVFPSPKTLKIIQNKAIQKEFFVANNIPTSKFEKFSNLENLKTVVSSSAVEMPVDDNLKSTIYKHNTVVSPSAVEMPRDNNLKSTKLNHNIVVTSSAAEMPFVWKSTEFGYDGTGVKIIRHESDLDNLPNVECIAEEMIAFKNELSVIVVRNFDGKIKNYPVVEMEFHPEANQVEYVICPARISDKIAQKAIEIALDVSKKINHVGLLAVEMFLTQDDQILVNEVAPRPHNSGHQTIEASFTSQFENHLRAVLNLPLGNCDSKLAGVMVNLVGEEGFSGNVKYQNIEKILDIDGVTPHIYGKQQTRPFRKMGHVTIVNENINEARRIAEIVKNSIRVISV